MARQTALFAADGAQVTGIDVEIPTYHLNPPLFFHVWQENGFERAFKSLVRHLLFDRGYRRKLAKLYPQPVPYARLDTRLMSASQIAFPDETFDFIYSIWVFEHIEDVPAAVREVNRVLKPSGAAAVFIHLFPSLSGGHNLAWLAPGEHQPRYIPAWDHLLDNRYPANFYLNRLRLEDFRKIFYQHLNVLDEDTFEEGDDQLTPERLENLTKKGYTRQDLLTRSVTFICRKLKRELP